MNAYNTALPLILASTSPRRQALMEQARLNFKTMAVEIDESQLSCESVSDYLYRMVANKADKAREQLNATTPTLVITADTVGLLDGVILGKPRDRAHAFAMWQAMSGNTHKVCTGVQATLVCGGDILWQQALIDTTEVTFITLNANDMANYWATGEPCDKAGAYAIQGFGATWVSKINGSYTNVVGLPLPRLISLIDDAGQWIR